jgi:Ca2+:H+ antiporter
MVNMSRRSQIISGSYLVGPLLTIIVTSLFWNNPPNAAGVLLITFVLIGAVLTAVHHAEVISVRIGEPFGALVLALAVTIIEVGLIIAIITSSTDILSSLGRDTVFSAIMITCNGIIGFSIVAATLRGGTASLNSEGSGASLGAIATIATLSLVLPTFTRSSSGPTFTTTQLIFAAIAALNVYLLFLYVLTVRHREHFQNPSNVVVVPYADKPTDQQLRISFILLLVSLVSIIGLAKVISPSVENVVSSAGLPFFVVAVSIALVVLLPETLAAIRAARRGDFQTSVNLGYGSAMASIGLTIPALAIASIALGLTLELGLNSTELVLFLLTMVVSVITVSSPRVTLLQGGIHLTIFAAFLVLAIQP